MQIKKSARLAGTLAVLLPAIQLAAITTSATQAVASGPACTISSNDPEYRFIAIPGDVASKNSNVEVRLGIHNLTAASRTYTVGGVSWSRTTSVLLSCGFMRRLGIR